MPNVLVELTNIIEPSTPNGTGLGVYQQGTPSVGTVDSSGQIDLHNIGADVDITFRVVDPAKNAGWVFATPGFTAQFSGPLPFGDPANAPGDVECEVRDANERATYKYTLHLRNTNDGRSFQRSPRDGSKFFQHALLILILQG